MTPDTRAPERPGILAPPPEPSDARRDASVRHHYRESVEGQDDVAMAERRRGRWSTESQIAAFDRVWDSPPGFKEIFREVNNIPIAHRFMLAGFVFFLAGGLMGLLMRIQLGTPENTFLDPETYNQLFTMHGTTMMFLFVIPFIEAIANYMLPLILGTRDLPFPKLTALSFWTYVFGGVLIFSSFLWGLAPNGGWFSYVPLNNQEWSPGLNMDVWDIGLSVAEVAAMGAAAELMVSILRMRAPGMSLARMPYFAWAMLVTAVMIIFAFTPLIVGTTMLELDRKGLTSFFKPEAGGEPLLWQHLFWVFGHPEVYIMFIPATGIVSAIVQTFARRPVVGYPLVVLSLVATGFISFGLWVHHMFTTGLPPVGMGFFAAASMIIAIPSGIQIFAWIATLWTGRPVLATPLLFVIGFIVIFVLGGVTGVMVAAVPFDAQVHDTYFVVAHFHYVLIGGVVFPLFAGLHYWLPKVTGRLLSERLGKWTFWVMFVGFHVTFFPMHVAGLLGMSRRVYTYPADIGLDELNLVSTVGAFVFAAGVLLFAVNFFWHRRHGAVAGPNPWGADTLEWAEPSPPPAAQYRFIPVVRSRFPLWDQADLDPDTPELTAALAPLDAAPTGYRAAVVVSVVEGAPRAIVHVPSSTYAPFTMSVGFLLLFAGLIIHHNWLMIAGGIVTAVAVGWWFWPLESYRKALEEYGMTDSSRAPREPSPPGSLPLAVAGPAANGYWGTMVFLLILATALATFVAAYFYLGEGPDSFPPPGQGTGEPLWPMVTTALGVLAAGATWWLARATRTDRYGARRAALAATLLLFGAAFWTGLRGFGSAVVAPQASAYGSAVAGLLGFHLVVTVVLLVMLLTAVAWAVRAPRDPRGDAVAINASLVGWFTVATWAIVAFTVYVGPRIW